MSTSSNIGRRCVAILATMCETPPHAPPKDIVTTPVRVCPPQKDTCDGYIPPEFVHGCNQRPVIRVARTDDRGRVIHNSRGAPFQTAQFCTACWSSPEVQLSFGSWVPIWVRR